MPAKHFVTSLQKGLQVLTCFDRLHSRLTVSDVARLTGSTPASARRSLLTLQDLGYLASDGKHFWMQPRCLEVAHAYLSSRPIPSLAQPLLDALSERTRESATLAKLLDDHAIIIARSTARRSLAVGLGIGSRLPAYCSALGRVLLSGLPDDELRRRLEAMPRPALTPHTVTGIDDLLALVRACRVDGYSSSDQELEIGVRSMAVPVFNRAGTMTAGLSIVVRADRMSMSECRDAFLPALLRAQARLRPQLFQD